MTSSWPEYLKRESLFLNAIRLRNLIFTIQRYIPINSRLIEAGFGSGYTAVLLADLGYQVEAVDVNFELVKNAEAKYADWIRDGKLRFVQGDILSLPYQNHEFVLAYNQGVFEHFDDEQIILGLTELNRVSDLLIFDVPNHRSGHQSFGDERLLSPSYWKILIQESNLNIVEELGRGFTKSMYLLPHGIFSKYMLSKFPWFSRSLGLSSIFVCR